ncbi:YfbM family protein [Hymenobacter sp.]|jgi:hypothetical protein|uniref:YfbM family protein n=1 Tax=Hymenobacter sp. TaxID=1898978 RepID=UPI002ED8FE07
MGMYCELLQVSPAYAQQLIQEPDRIFDCLEEPDLIEDGALGEDINLDKAWHGLHYLLTGTAWGGQEPACYLVTGGEQIGDEVEHDIGYGPARLLSPAQVAAFAAITTSLTPAEIQERLNPNEMTQLDIYPEVWSRVGQDAQDNYDYLVEYATELQGFLARATDQQLSVVIYLI